MILRNLFRRKGRTTVTLLGIAIGVAAIVALGAAAQGIRVGFAGMAQGSQADLVFTQSSATSTPVSSIDEAIADQMRLIPEVADVDGMLYTNAVIDDTTSLIVFGYDPDGFAVARFRVVEGEALAEVRSARGKPIILGRRAAQNMNAQVGDTLRITGSGFRVVGIYETGNGWEDRAAIVSLQDAQALALQPHRITMLYVRLNDPRLVDQFRTRVERRFSDLTGVAPAEFVNEEKLLDLLDGVAMAVAGLAVIVGGITMMNTLSMSVLERTHEIGLLRSLGWRQRQVLGLILSESLTLSLLGGLLGTGLGVLVVLWIANSNSWLSTFGSHFTPDLFIRALVTVVLLGLTGGVYPAWRASRLLPLEALRHHGGGDGTVPRFLPGTTVRNLWRRRTRTTLTLLGIGVSIAAIITVGGLVQGVLGAFNAMMQDSQTDLFVAQAEVDTAFSAIDERMGARIAARPSVSAISGMFLATTSTDEMPMLFVYGYHPREFAIRRYRIVAGEPLMGGRQILVGRIAANRIGLKVGDTFRMYESNFRVIGIYETGHALEDAGVLISLREAQSLIGKPRQVQFYLISLHDPEQAEVVRNDLAAAFPEVDFSLTSELNEAMSAFQVLEEMVDQLSFLAASIGALGMLNTMLMSVLERTREIGVLRSLGWRRRQVLGMIVKESLLLGAVGGVCGIFLGLGMGELIGATGVWGGALEPAHTPQMFMQAIVIALMTGVVGGIYPAWRATRMQPVEALRYE